MARRKKAKLPFVSFKPELDAGAKHEILAIILALLALLLLFGVFGFGGSLVRGLFSALRVVIGYSSYLLPFILGLLVYMLFKPDEHEVKANNYLGFTGIIIALSGIFHLGAGNRTLEVAKAGKGGGFIGYLVVRGMLNILNVPASAIILLALLAVCLVVAANARLSDMLKGIMGLFRREPGEEIQINEPVGASTLPVRGIMNVGGRKEAPAEDNTALTGGHDESWKGPGFELLQATTQKANAGNVKENAATIQTTLASFGIEVVMGEVNVGPTVAQYTLKPPSGVKLNKITGLEHNLSLSLAAHPIRIEAPIPGKSAVGVEIPNKTAALVRLRDIIESDDIQKSTPLTFVLGRDVAGTPAIADLAAMPHLMIAGATGSGKSIMINSLLMSLLFRNAPSDLKIILVDPKRVELSSYNDIPHLLTPVIVEPEKCISALKWAVAEMERRYKLLQEVNKRNISEYNAEKKNEHMPFIVIIIDELADLMAVAAGDVEALIVRLAQMARAVGIHLVLATQRPSVNVITGLIKANIPARLAFTVASQIDSRTILDQSGAEKLLGKGDMLFLSPEMAKPRRIQGALIDEKELKAVTDYLRSAGAPQYNEDVQTQQVKIGRGGIADMDDADDTLFQEAADTVIRSGKASASLLQRRLRVGYARAARLLDILEERGIIGPPDGARPRDVLVTSLSDIAEDVQIED